MKTHHTPYNIKHLESNEIFVFGSNLSGKHSAGAAKMALRFGAIYGQGEGLQGRSYAIPTKDFQLRTLPIEKIKIYVDRFVIFAINNPHMIFLVTTIGCGLAGYSPEDIAPLFKNAIESKVKNIIIPESFII